MKINIEAQLLCIEKKYLRGVPQYLINLLNAFSKRDRNQYTVSFFDFKNERNNRKYIEDYLGSCIPTIELCECNEISFKDIMEAVHNNDVSLYRGKKYSDYIGYHADIYHFPAPANVAQNVDGKVVVTIHDIMPLLPQFRHYWDDNHYNQFKSSMQYIRDSENITLIADSQSTKNDLVDVLDISADRIFVVPISYDSNTVYRETNPERLKKMGIENPYILYLGALDYRKGIVETIQAFDIVKTKYPELKLVLAGNTEVIFKDELKRTLEKSNYRSDIIFPGFVNNDEKRWLISGAETFLFLSEYEGFGIPVLESMACGTPMITTRAASIPEVGGDAVLYAKQNDSEDAAEKIEMLLADQGLRKIYAAKGMEQKSRFSWDKTAELTEQVYAKMM